VSAMDEPAYRSQIADRQSFSPCSSRKSFPCHCYKKHGGTPSIGRTNSSVSELQPESFHFPSPFAYNLPGSEKDNLQPHNFF
jgi:hypothetical protein